MEIAVMVTYFCQVFSVTKYLLMGQQSKSGCSTYFIVHEYG